MGSDVVTWADSRIRSLNPLKQIQEIHASLHAELVLCSPVLKSHVAFEGHVAEVLLLRIYLQSLRVTLPLKVKFIDERPC